MEGIQMYQAKILLAQGYSRQMVAEALEVSRRTVYNYEHGAVFNSDISRGRPKGSGKLTPFLTYIGSALGEDFTLNAELLLEKLLLVPNKRACHRQQGLPTGPRPVMSTII